MKKFIAILYIGITAILINAVYWQKNFSIEKIVNTQGVAVEEKKDVVTKGVVLGVTDSINELEYDAIVNSKMLSKKFPQNPIAGIVPHDVYMGEYIAHFFSQLSTKTLSPTIILVGPDHFERGVQTLTTSDASWGTEFGIIRPDSETIHQLHDKKIARIELPVVKSEHSITAIIPYIARYFPQAKIVPVIMKAATTQEDLGLLLDALQDVSEDVIVVGAIDFSHYLLPPESDANDVYSAQALETMDESFFLSLQKNFNDYVDSPASVAFVIDWARNRGAQQGNIMYHMNRADKTGLRNQPSTSYFEAVFY